MMSEYPHPLAFELKLLPAPFTTDMQSVLGAVTGFRYSGGHWNWRSQQAMFFDGHYDVSGDTMAWTMYLRHAACQDASRGYEFGKGHHPPKHWLVFDWEDKQVWAGPGKSARRFLEAYWVRFLSQMGIPEIIERDAEIFTMQMLEYLRDHPEEVRDLPDEAETDEAGRPVRRLEGIQKYARFGLELDMTLRAN